MEGDREGDNLNIPIQEKLRFYLFSLSRQARSKRQKERRAEKRRELRRVLRGLTGSKSKEAIRREWEKQKKKNSAWTTNPTHGWHYFQPKGCEKIRFGHYHFEREKKPGACGYWTRINYDHDQPQKKCPHDFYKERRGTGKDKYQSSPLNTAARNSLPVPARPPSENRRGDIRKQPNLVQSFKKISVEEYRKRRALIKNNRRGEIKHHDIRVVLPTTETEEVDITSEDRPPTPGRGLELVLYEAAKAREKTEEFLKEDFDNNILNGFVDIEMDF